MGKFSIARAVTSLVRDKNGNFAMMAAIALPILLMASGLAVDVTNAFSMKTRMQNAVDAATLATVTRLTEEKDLSIADAKAFAAQFLNGQIAEDFAAFSDMAVTPDIAITPIDDNGRTVWRVSIALSGSKSVTPMAKLMGQDKLTIGVIASSESARATQGSISMTLVLDRSGSMGWRMDGRKKIDVLKTAVGELLDQLATADPQGKYVRVGATSYNSKMTGFQNIAWNLDKTRSFVGALPASGGTDSTDAFGWAHNRLQLPSEVNKHKAKTGQIPEKFIVFMTDGDNNYRSADTSTRILCDKAKADGVHVYTVAFAAPSRGKQLLSYCASSPENFFDASNSAELIAAFKNIGVQAAKIVSRLTR